MTNKGRAWVLLLFWTSLTFIVNHYASSEWVEHYYTNGLFQWWRKGYDYTIYHLPFAFSYLIFMMLLMALYFGGRSLIKSKKKKYVSWLTHLLALILITYNSFYWLWAFNYRIRNISQRLQLHAISLDTTMVYNEVLKVNEVLQQLRSSLGADTIALSVSRDHHTVEAIIRQSQQKLLSRWEYNASSSIHVRALHPSGTLLIWSTAGIYNPYSLEGHYDTGMFHVQSTYVIAHEMAHGYGVTNEADCNFIALLTCAYTGDKYIQYCGMLTYWRYLMSDLRDKAPYSFYKVAYHRPLGVRKDITALYEALDKYPDVLPQIRDIIYDQYLKSNGIQEGLKSYNRVVDMMMSYNKDGRYEHLYKVIGQ